jgi:hypothetical protein
MARQGELFGGSALGRSAHAGADALPLLARQLQEWQARLATHQQPLFADRGPGAQQGSLFAGPPEDPQAQAERFQPLSLQPQPLSFWRWPAAPQQGAALYVVTDRPASLPQPLLLYVGETSRADQRWKGEHDCKAYLAAYSETLLKVGLSCQLSIRFWLDVPLAVRPRRALEQALIRRWLPPFNKETRSRWATPFQADPT